MKLDMGTQILMSILKISTNQNNEAIKELNEHFQIM